MTTLMRDIRSQCGMSLVQFAFMCQVDDGNLSKVERGWKKLGDQAQDRVALALGVERKELFYQTGYAKPSIGHPSGKGEPSRTTIVEHMLYCECCLEADSPNVMCEAGLALLVAEGIGEEGDETDGKAGI